MVISPTWWSRLMPMKPWFCGSQWWKRWRSTSTISGGSLKRFAVLQLVWPWRKFWLTSIIAKTINQSIRTKSKAHFSATNQLVFSWHARIIKMVNCQLQLPPRRVISRELHRYCVSIKPSPIHWKNSTNKSKLYIVSDGCASQFRSRYVFSLLTHIHPDITIEWHYNEAHHGKDPMDGTGDTVKNLLYRRVLSGDAVISTPWEFAEFANQITSVDCLFLDKSEFIQEPEEVSKATPNPSTLKVHKASCVRNGSHSFSNHFSK